MASDRPRDPYNNQSDAPAQAGRPPAGLEPGGTVGTGTLGSAGASPGPIAASGEAAEAPVKPDAPPGSRAATGPAGGPKDLSSLGLDQDPDLAADAPNAIEGKRDRR